MSAGDKYESADHVPAEASFSSDEGHSDVLTGIKL